MKNYIPILFSLLVCASCSNDSGTITYILPDGYEGLILTTEDKHTGKDLVSSNGTYVIHVPQNGRVVLTNDKPLTEWHKTKVQYENGTEIPFMDPSAAKPIAFYGLPYIQGKGMYDLVGTEEDYKTVSHSFDLSVLPLGNKNLKALSPPGATNAPSSQP